MCRLIILFVVFLTQISCKYLPDYEEIGIKISHKTEEGMWYFIVPIKNEKEFNFSMFDSSFLANKEGVIYIPQSRTSKKEYIKFFIYDQYENITEKVKYMGFVENYGDSSEVKYRYYVFYVPSTLEKGKADSYWIENRTEISFLKVYRFKKLINDNKITFF